MSCSQGLRIISLALILLGLAASPAFAEEPESKEESKEKDASSEEGGEESKEDAVEDDEEEESEESEEDEKKESEHGSYEFKRSFGGGVEFGLFFTKFGRWNLMLDQNDEPNRFDTDVALNLDLAFEASPVEGARFTLFGGIQGPGASDPSISALYIGLEPAFAFRRDRWEIALGSGVGVGRLDFALDNGAQVESGLVLLRPFIEARTYAAKFAAFYARFGFNYWHVYDAEFTNLEAPVNVLNIAQASNLNEGGAYLAVGTRFGYYPEHVKVVPDTDEDGLRDDIDDCPDQPEDLDGFEDEDGCPELDNDKDGVNDDADKCALEAEDKDGYQDEDGCPDPDNDGDGFLDADDECPLEAGIAEKKGCPIRDKDGDGIFDEVDKCVTEPEDKDGYLDEDGCPDPDNDGDGLLDGADQCPNEPELMNGYKDEDGCPEKDTDQDGIIDDKDKCIDKPETYNGNKDDDGCPDGKQTVVITETEIKILEKVFFTSGKSTIQKKSYKLLNTVAIALSQNPQVTKIMVEGHTDDVGKNDSNKALSQERAQAVVDYIVSKGIDAKRLEAKGFGEEAPLCTDIEKLLENAKKNKKALDACRGDNRRVQFKIIELNNKPVDAAESVKIKETKVIEEPAPTN